MLDFLMISTRQNKGCVEVFPKFIIKSSDDLMIRGGDFYAVWDEENQLWSTDEEIALRMIDQELDKYAEEHKPILGLNYKVLHMWDADSGSIDRWHKYVQKQSRDKWSPLDEKLIFSNTKTTKKDYASKRLSYPLMAGDISAYDELMSVLYSPEERHKIEWAIGCIVSGKSVKTQKFLVLYGSAGTGKSTVLNIIQDLFAGYYSVFDAKALGSLSNSFALEAFKSNPLVAIQHDGDLSRIEDNTRLNSVVSHEVMTVNEKFKAAYAARFNAFLFMGTNRPVKITDAKSGILRRLIDVSPTGDKLSQAKYNQLTKEIKFELGSIAQHCLEVYEEDPHAYDGYVPLSMMGSTNDFYNFVLDNYEVFKKENGIALKAAWEMFKTWCDETRVPINYSQRVFKEELKNYFYEFEERSTLEDGSRIRNYYSGFATKRFESNVEKPSKKNPDTNWLSMGSYYSEFDRMMGGYPAQYATKDKPTMAWDQVTTKLCDLDTRETHYVQLPINHIVIDFDLKDETGKKSREKNLAAAAKWPKTYAEFSKSGAGIHLHYIYDGDPTVLSRVYDDGIEIKVFTGKASLRRKLSECNQEPIKIISSGLPIKEERKLVNQRSIKTEASLRRLLVRNLEKEFMPGTKPSIDFMKKILDDAYESGMKYDVSNMRPAIRAFASGSTHQSDYCLKLIKEFKWKSDEGSEASSFLDESDDGVIIFYDVEVFPNLLLVNWKKRGITSVHRMINPSASEISELVKHKLVGFNCRRYDNHILYARMIGCNNEEIYNLSKRIIGGDRSAFFGEAYNISYTDVYDFSAKKQSLKKFEIELGIHHQELGLDWDKPVPKEKWEMVAEYCDNDVIATEAVFEHLQADFTARQILADLVGGTVNETTNTLTQKLIFGQDRNPQETFLYRNLAEPVYDLPEYALEFLKENFPDMMAERHGKAKSLLPYFEGYEFKNGKSTYQGEEAGEGGFVWAKPGMYGYTITFDVASMHPHSITSEVLFGPYTKMFNELMNVRICIKHKDFEKAKTMFGGKLAKYLDDPGMAKALSNALKIAINSVYGLTASKYETRCRDKRNIDNIVAKRGALFMITLLHNILDMGGDVIHIKTDSIKVHNPSPELIDYILNFGKKYGYDFEVEHKFEKICLVNNAVYIAKLAEDDPDEPGVWTATGTQFQIPYVFKTLFSKEPITFSDMCETKSVSTNMFLNTGEDYRFVGKVGSFCPMKNNGFDLLREGTDKNGQIKYDNVTGAKGFKWMEAEMVKALGLENDIDKTYYNNMVDEAVNSISEYGDFEWFRT